MVEEHAEMQMIQRALAGTVEREDECALGKIGRLRNADEGKIDIELLVPPGTRHSPEWREGHGHKK